MLTKEDLLFTLNKTLQKIKIKITIPQNPLIILNKHLPLIIKVKIKIYQLKLIPPNLLSDNPKHITESKVSNPSDLKIMKKIKNKFINYKSLIKNLTLLKTSAGFVKAGLNTHFLTSPENQET
jgi:hypothetical protein